MAKDPSQNRLTQILRPDAQFRKHISILWYGSQLEVWLYFLCHFLDIQSEAIGFFERDISKEVPPGYAVAGNSGFAPQSPSESPIDSLNPEFPATAL
jgi:hypothetical protein